MRILLVVPPLTGHITPLRAVAQALAANGHEVAWCGPQPATSLLTGGRMVFPAGDSVSFAVQRRPANLRGFAALKFLWEHYLIPLADAMVPGVTEAVATFSPDVLLVDQQALAGAVVARLSNLPWATSASTSTELADPLSELPKIAGWITGLQDDLCARHNVPGSDLRFSPLLVLAFTTCELAGQESGRLAAPVHYVGPPAHRKSSVDFPWPALDSRPLVLVTLGTANAEVGRRFLTESVDALATRPDLQGVVVDPSGDLLSDEVLLLRQIPQVELLQRAAVVVCHGGHNTVCEALREGVPLVVAPIRDDQSMLAQRVLTVGAGVRLRFDRAKANDISNAITTVLTTPDYAKGAARIQHSFATAGGATAAARYLQSLATR